MPTLSGFDRCGWGVGLARASLRSARRASEAVPSILLPEIEQLELALSTYWSELSEGIDGGRLQREPAFLPIVTPTAVQLKTELARASALPRPY